MNDTVPRFFSKKSEFVDWIIAEQSQTANLGGSFLCVGYDSKLFALRADITKTKPLPMWTICAYNLPIAKATLSQIWSCMQELGLCVFFSYSDSERSILLATRFALWHSLNDRFLVIPKSQYVEIAFEDARAVVNDLGIWQQMLSELRECGICCRVWLHDADVTPSTPGDS